MFDLSKRKKNKKYIALIGLVVFTFVLGFVVYNRPEFIYLKGRLMSKLFLTPKVLGSNVFRLPTKFHRQEHSLSCEIAALKMALNGVEIEVSESALIDQLAFDPTPKSKGIWGDPFKGFVGNIDGKMGVTGYGVYWQPIEEVADKYTYSEVIENATPQQLAKHLRAGRPIVWWGYYGRGKKLSWSTPEGLAINAINGEHARTLIGFTGNEENPTGFILLDPIYGEQYWETEDLLKNSGPFNNSGVVVYPTAPLFEVRGPLEN